uniref:Myb-like domain-containing protein n=1 Tax=Oryza glaberrima TaxID=4538 RepID=I1QTK3_ORYGL
CLYPQSPQFPQSQAPNFHNFHPFGPPANYQLYGNPPPSFHGFQQQGNWLQSAALSFQGFCPQESWMHSPNQVGGSASSHGYESTSPCPATSQAKSVVNIEESSGNNEEAWRKGTRVNWTEEENLRLLSSWLNNSVDPIDSNDKKSEYYWRAVAAESNNNTRRNDRKRTIVKSGGGTTCRGGGASARRDGEDQVPRCAPAGRATRRCAPAGRLTGRCAPASRPMRRCVSRRPSPATTSTTDNIELATERFFDGHKIGRWRGKATWSGKVAAQMAGGGGADGGERQRHVFTGGGAE